MEAFMGFVILFAIGAVIGLVIRRLRKAPPINKVPERGQASKAGDWFWHGNHPEQKTDQEKVQHVDR